MSGSGAKLRDSDPTFRRKAAYLVCDGQLQEWEVADLLDRDPEDVKAAVADYLARGENSFDAPLPHPAKNRAPNTDEAFSKEEVWPDLWPELPAIQTVARIRPLNTRELGLGSHLCAEAPNDKEVLFKLNERELRKQAVSADFKRQKMKEFLSFPVHHAFGMDSQQQAVYEASGRPVLAKVIKGYNGCILAYGQTGAGKTFTMEGNVVGWGSIGDPNASGTTGKKKRKKGLGATGKFSSSDMPGVIPLVFADLFEGIARLENSVTFDIKVTYVEIYRETVIDLLADASAVSNARAPDVVEDKRRGGKGVHVQGAREVKVESLVEVMELLQDGLALRRTGETEMNKRSSRSHAVLSIYLTSSRVDDYEQVTKVTSKMHLVDLAGSERLKDTNAKGQRLQEGNAINSSLSTLAACLKSMCSAGKIPRWRESKITRLLQDSLGGNAYSVILCALSPALVNEDESLSTIRFASMAQKIKAQPKQTLDPMTQLKLQNKALKKQVALLSDVLREAGLGAEVEDLAPATPAKSKRGSTKAPPRTREHVEGRAGDVRSRSRSRSRGVQEAPRGRPANGRDRGDRDRDRDRGDRLDRGERVDRGDRGGGEEGGKTKIKSGGGGSSRGGRAARPPRIEPDAPRVEANHYVASPGGGHHMKGPTDEDEASYGIRDRFQPHSSARARAATANLKAKRHRSAPSKLKGPPPPASMRGSAEPPVFPSVRRQAPQQLTYGEIHGGSTGRSRDHYDGDYDEYLDEH